MLSVRLFPPGRDKEIVQIPQHVPNHRAGHQGTNDEGAVIPMPGKDDPTQQDAGRQQSQENLEVRAAHWLFPLSGRCLKQIAHVHDVVGEVASEFNAGTGRCDAQAGEGERAVGATDGDDAADASRSVTDGAGAGNLLNVMLFQFLQSRLTHRDSPHVSPSIGKGWDALYVMIWHGLQGHANFLL
jgi:hypothetical protein